MDATRVRAVMEAATKAVVMFAWRVVVLYGWLAGIFFPVAIGVIHDNDVQRAGLHARFVQNCILGTDEPEDECEARWNKALKP
jgi:hypothetical protein